MAHNKVAREKHLEAERLDETINVILYDKEYEIDQIHQSFLSG